MFTFLLVLELIIVVLQCELLCEHLQARNAPNWVRNPGLINPNTQVLNDIPNLRDLLIVANCGKMKSKSSNPPAIQIKYEYKAPKTQRIFTRVMRYVSVNHLSAREATCVRAFAFLFWLDS